MTTPRRIRVAVIFGGRSPEHGVSAVSAGSVIGALDQGEFEVVPVGITRDGQWVLTDGTGLALDGRSMPEITSGSGSAVVLPGDPTAKGLVVVDPARGRPRTWRRGRGVPGSARRIRRGRHHSGPF